VPKLRLTDLGLLNLALPPKLTDYWDQTLPTFGVRVSPRGTKTFVLKLRTGRQAIGRYPIIKLSEAREEAKRILAERTLGKLRPQSVTYKEAVRLFIEDKRKARPKSADQYEWFLDRLNFTCQLSNIHQSDIERELKKVKSTSTYDHVLVAARIMFNWAHKRRYITENPTIGIHRPCSQPRSRILSDPELKSVWRACSGMACHHVCDNNSSGKSTPSLPKSFGIIVKLLMLTGQRRGEIAALRRPWIQDDKIIFPPEITKNRKEHHFPVGRITKECLTGWMNTSIVHVGSSYLFPAKGKPNSPFNGWSKSKALLDQLSGVEDWTLHDIRRTFRSNLGRLGIAPHIAERLVNHVSAQTDMERVYDQYKYLPELRDAMETYEDWLSSLVTEG
jgi:integrase